MADDDPYAQFDTPDTNADPYAQFDAPAPPPPKNYSWGEVPGAAASNLGSSALNFGKAVAQPFMHPQDTALALGRTGMGAVEKLIPGQQGHEQYADAVGKFYMDRYGSMEGFKRALAEDPVGVMADASMFLTGGETALGRVPGVIGDVAKAAGTVGRAVDPLNAAGKVAKAGIHGVDIPTGTGNPVQHIPGLYEVGTDMFGGSFPHTGGQALRTALESGYENGPRAEAFRNHMRGDNMAEVVADARQAVSNLRLRRGQQYRINKLDLKAAPEPIQWGPIDEALSKIETVRKFKNQDLADPVTRNVRARLTNEIDNWKKLDPAEYHTAEGIDALKQKIGNIRDNLKYGTPARFMADEVYRALWGQIAEQAPQYGKMMKDYETASHHIRELEGSLSLGRKASTETALRKLQSIMRNNANTSYGMRLNLGKMLQDAGATHLMDKLAGQALNTLRPRGLGAVQMGTTAALGAMSGQFLNPAYWAAIIGSSPRIMGEALHKVGQGARYVAAPFKAANRPLKQIGVTPRGIGAAAFQAGRQPWEDDDQQQ